MIVNVIGRDDGIEKMFNDLGHRVYVLENPFEEFNDERDRASLVVFTGGHDVTPILYNERNTASANSTNRDMKEMVFFHRFHNTPKLGICRGGQFLNVMSGGKMVQDFPGHAIVDTHIMADKVRGKRINVTSTHHQVMLKGANGTIYGYAENPDGNNTLECLWYNSTNSLCFQPHPEYLPADRAKNEMLGFLRHVFANNWGYEL